MTERPVSRSVADGAHRALLADSVAAFTGRGTDAARARRLRGSNEEYDRAAWRRMAELGWLGILVPDTHGGLGLGLSEMGIVARGLARALAPEPLVASAVMATTALARGSSEALKREYLPRIVAGEIVPVLAWQETAGDWGVESPALQALPLEGGYQLTGVKRFIAGAAQADAFLVSALVDAGLALFWVARDTAGARLKLEPLADGRHFGTLTLTDALVSREHVLARGPEAADALARALDYGAAIASAELCGVAERALEISLDYLKTRVQFGKPIGSFQALQHRAVDLYIQKELAGAVLDQVLETLGEAPDAASRAALASRLKARCSDAALRVTREAIQLHGAIGFTDDCDIGLYLKRALVLAAWLGSARQHRRRYADLSGVNRES
jgi:alkylation response protein AidB-like acyl-CoA dehydrogenase